METIPSRKQNAPAGNSAAGGRAFKVGDMIADATKEKPAEQQPEAQAVAEVTTETLIGIRYPVAGVVVNYAADTVEESAHVFKLLKKVEGKEPQLVAIYQKQTGTIVEAFDPVSIERTNYIQNAPTTGGYWSALIKAIFGK